MTRPHVVTPRKPPATPTPPPREPGGAPPSRLYRALFESAPDAIIGMALDGTITLWSPAAERIFRYSASEMVGTSVFSIVPPERVPEERALLTRAAVGEGAREYETVRTTKEGVDLQVAVTVTPIRDESGAVEAIVSIVRSLQDLKHVDEKNLQLAAIVESSNDAIIGKSLDSIVTSWNPAAERLFGYSAVEIIGKPVGTIIPPSRLGEEGLIIARAAAGQKTVHYETTRVRRDGSLVDVSLTISPIRHTDGRVIGVSTIARDITDRKRTGEQLRRAGDYARSLIEASLDPLVTISPDGKITDVNTATERVTGVGRKRLIGSDFSDYFTEPDKAREGYLKVFQEGSVTDYPLAIRHVSGNITHVLYNASVYRDDTGMVQGVFAAARDITQRLKADREIKKASDYARSLIEASLDPLVTISPDGKITDVNTATERVTGVAREKLIGSDFSDYFTEPEKAREGYTKVFREGSVTDYPLAIRHTSGRITNVLYNASVYEDEYGNVQGVFASARDITERKATEEQLKKASNYARSLIEASLDPLVTISPDGKITDVNRATEVVTGYGRKKLIGSDFSDYFTEPARAQEGYKRTFELGSVTDYALAIRHAGGRITNVLFNASVYKDETGKVQGVFAAARDITQRLKADREIKKASDYARSLIEASLDPLVTISPDGKITDVNTATERATGVPRDTLIGSDFSEYFTRPDRAREGYLKVFREGSVTDYPLAIRHRDGRVTNVLYNASVYEDEHGNVRGVFAAARDVTARQAAEEQLKAASAYARSLIEASLDPLVTISPDGKITDVNTATERVTGVPRDKLIGSDFSIYFTEAEKAREGYKRAFELGSVTDYPLAIRHADGRVTEVLYNASVYRDERDHVQGVFAAARDVTARKATEAAASRQAGDLQRSNTDLERFAYIASHDLQEPLRTVTGAVQTIQRQNQGKLGPETDECIKFALDGAARMRTLIDNLLAYSRSTSRGLAMREVPMRALVDAAIANMAASIESTHARVEVAKLPRVAVDEQQMTQVLQNLLSNALKFHKPGEPPRVAVSARRSDDTWTFIVRDEGIGIAPKHHRRIFEIFQRLDPEGRYEGTGIGLAIAQRIVERHGGRIWVESAPGAGASFMFTLPAGKEGATP